MLRKSFLISLLVFFLFSLSGNISYLENKFEKQEFEGNNHYRENWVDSVFNSLTLDQRIAQLFIIAADSDKGEENSSSLEHLIRKYNPGGICFFKGTLTSQAQLTNKLQNAATTPLFVAMDAEWGPAMRLEGVSAFPHQITLGAISDNNLVYQMGIQVGKQLTRLGVNMSFSPVLDVNNNPHNPVINFRSFGESRENVAQKGIAYMRGLQDTGIIAVAKHFPGHGDTRSDSHHSLPFIDLSKKELDSIHIYPFRQLINKGLGAIMVAHLEVPALEPSSNIPSSLSKTIIGHLLKEEIGFEGLVITDALNMRGATSGTRQGELELLALQAGNDILLMPENLPVAINFIKNAIQNGELSQELLEKKVKKILGYKYLVGLNKSAPVSIANIENDINNRQVSLLNKKLAESSITLLQNKNSIVPLKDIDTKKIAVLSIGALAVNPFQEIISHHVDVTRYSIAKNHGRHETNRILNDLETYDLVIVSIHRSNISIGRNYGINRENIYLANQLAKRQETIVTVFANPYSLNAFGQDLLNASAVLLGYQDGQHFEEAAAQVIVGGVGAKGKLPVSLQQLFPLFKGEKTLDNFRVKLCFPEEVGIDPVYLAAIDTIVKNGIDSMAFPGCQVAVIKDGVLIYNKAFGHHTYENKRPVELSDLYDLASITKIAATTAAIMQLSDKRKINIDNPLARFFDLPKASNKGNITLRRILAHNGRLRAWIPFFSSTLNDEDTLSKEHYSTTQSRSFPTQVSNNIFLKKDYTETIFKEILESELLRSNRYRYSDLGFILLTKIIEDRAGIPLDKYVHYNLAKPMGLSTLTFKPLENFSPEQIVPTEIENGFRNQVIHGHVHDPTAAMMGGVAGHTGLFSNSLHLAILMQMFLNGGNYAGQKFIEPQTIERFTSVQFPNLQNRRGIGFDKPDKNTENSPASKSASARSFGHMGFTGTFAWADPDEMLVVVFLSNRTYPSSSNRLINVLDIRRRIQQAVYDAINKSKPNYSSTT